MSLFWNKLPRAKLTVSLSTIVGLIFRLPFVKLGRGAVTENFENLAAKYFKVNHVYSLSSCRMGIYYTLRALNLKQGQEVLLPPLTIPDIVNAIHVLGLKPVFVEMSHEAQSICVIDLESKINSSSKVLILTYLSGYVPDLDKILEICEKNNMHLVEDISQNYGATFNGKMLGTFGIASSASLTITKPLTSIGGGIFMTNNSEIYNSVKCFSEAENCAPDKIVLFRQLLYIFTLGILTSNFIYTFFTYYVFRVLSFLRPGSLDKIHDVKKSIKHTKLDDFYRNPPILRNSMPKAAHTWFSDFQSRVAIEVLETLEENNKKRIELAKIFISELSSSSKEHLTKEIVSEHENIYFHLPLFIKDGRSKLQEYLFNHYIDTTGYGLRLCSELPAFERYQKNLPIAKEIKEETLFLPIHADFKPNQLREVAQVLNNYFLNTKANL